MKNSDSSLSGGSVWKKGEVAELLFFIGAGVLAGWYSYQLKLEGAPIWKVLLVIWAAFHVVWLGPALWEEYIAWIQRHITKRAAK